jgi:multicomponent Na+:H+ antiporter subunit G
VTTDIAAIALAIVGAFFVASATLGALRFPDVFTRMHAITKAGTLGVGLFMVAVAVHFGSDVSLVTRALGVLLFTLLTAPASAQMIGRAAYVSGAERAKETRIDELAQHYARPEDMFAARQDHVERTAPDRSSDEAVDSDGDRP